MIAGGVSGGETSAEGLGSTMGEARSHPVREAATRSNGTVAWSALSEPPYPGLVSRSPLGGFDWPPPRGLVSPTLRMARVPRRKKTTYTLKVTG